MLNNLKQVALQYFSVPASFSLAIEDMNEEGATFFWKEAHSDEGYLIRLNLNGQLLSLSQPLHVNGNVISAEAQQQIAEQFLTSQYVDALHYFTLATIQTKPQSQRYYYKQFVGGVPLQSAYCTIDVSNDGQLMNFEYKAYVANLPKTPVLLAAKEPILEKLTNAEWTKQLVYLSSELYTVPRSGVYAVYYSPFVYHSFDAATGKDLLESDEAEEIEVEQQETFVPLPTVERDVPLSTVEEMIGITPSMQLIRSSEEDGYTGMVWRDETYEQPSDKSMNQFVLDRFEQTVKAKVCKETGELRGFVWFKERTGNLSLSFKACEEIAVKFLNTYFPAFVPYLQMKVQDESYNEKNRAFFHFPLFVDGLPLEGEFFMLSVNKTTGFIDTLITPRLTVKELEDFCTQPLLRVEAAKEALRKVDAVLEWDKRYEKDEPREMLIYRFKDCESQLSIRYIDATTGELILMRE